MLFFDSEAFSKLLTFPVTDLNHVATHNERLIKFFWNPRMSLQVFKLLRRNFRTISPKAKTDLEMEAAEDLKIFKMKQQRFQKDDDLPVFLKGGALDRFLYKTTLGFAGLGLIGSFGFIINYAFPPKDEQDGDDKENKIK